VGLKVVWDGYLIEVRRKENWTIAYVQCGDVLVGCEAANPDDNGLRAARIDGSVNIQGQIAEALTSYIRLVSCRFSAPPQVTSTYKKPTIHQNSAF
jgi:hypothetical protein